MYVRLTRDLFFRLIDDGEALICHAVLLARNGPVLIQRISLTLKRNGSHNTAEKVFPIQILRFGEKVKGPALTAEHHFFSSSPLLYLPENAPLRAVYLGVQREYYPRQRRALQNFSAKILELKRKYNPTATQPQPLDLEAGEQALEELNTIIDESSREMVALVQLETGKYEAAIEVQYESPGSKLWRRKGTSRSKISFYVEEQALTSWKAQLEDVLRISAKNGLTNSTDVIRYPEFQPLEFIESDQKF